MGTASRGGAAVHEAAVSWRQHGSGVEALHMTCLERLGGVVAYFTGRSGGVSPQWQGGLNWSFSVGDRPENVEENRRRGLAVAGLSPNRAAVAGLVHGRRVVAVTGSEPAGAGGMRLIPDCDGLVTDLVGFALVVTAADCVPLFFYDPVARAVGVAHAGWRGTVAGVGAATVEAMVAHFGCRPASIRAAIGPSIGPCCFEVGKQVIEPLREYYGAAADELMKPAGPGKAMVDLWKANLLDLKRAGVQEVFAAKECTACGVARLFSHRAEGGQAGRGAAIIALT